MDLEIGAVTDEASMFVGKVIGDGSEFGTEGYW